MEELSERSRNLSLDDIEELIDLIMDNRKVLCEFKDEYISEATRKMAYHLMKMVRVLEEVNFVWKNVRRHREDPALKSLTKPFQFISLNCHAELALLKVAKDCCKSKTLYIGVSKRPCYCCSLFFKAIEQNKSTDFNISVVTTHGKLYGNWNRIENCFENEFNQVWIKVIEDKKALERPKPPQTDDNSSESASSADEGLSKMRLRNARLRQIGKI